MKLQLCPSGVLYPHITSVIGNGVVVNPATLIRELDMLMARGVDVAKVRVSRSAHVIMPYHVALDKGNETRLADAKVGTTGRGIGPTYGDRAWRLGLRMEDLCDEPVLRERIERALADKNLILEHMGAASLRGGAARRRRRWRGASACAPHLDDTTWLVQHALRRGDHVLLEGAQGTLLDLDHGSYPFVTSSNPVAGGACTGGGIGPLQVDEVIGVMKAYSTRVGSGPFPTELLDDMGHGIAERGREFGTVTGRPRRVGWFDTVPLRYAVAVNSNHAIVLNKLDILSGIETIRLCVAYEIDGRRVETWPSSAATRSSRAMPVYEDFEGWEQPIHDVRCLADLPEAARRYVTALEEHAGVPIVFVSVGPERTQTIERAWRPMRHRPTGLTGDDARSCRPGCSCSAAAAASTRSPGSSAREPGVNEVIVAPGSGGDRAASRASACVRPSTRSIRRRSSRWPGATRRSSSSSDPRRRWRPAWPTRCARPGSPCSGRPRGGRGSRRRRRSATRSPRRRASGWRGRGRSRPASAAARRLHPRAGRAGARRRLKADGLAAGKGVIVTDVDRGRRSTLAPSFLAGAAGGRSPRSSSRSGSAGREASVIAICDGTGAVALPAARDHKRLCDGDHGPNTGGMGAYSPLPDLDDAAVERVLETVHRPILAELARRGTPFRGFLYAGLMLTADGPRAARVQRPPRRPGGAGHPAAARRARSGRCCSPRPAARSRIDVAGAAPGAARRRGRRSCWRPRATPATRAAATRSPGSTRRPRRARSSSTPGRSAGRGGGFGTNGGRVADGRRPRADARGGARRRRASGGRDRMGRAAAPARHRPRPAGARRGAAHDPALHAARDGRAVVRAGPLRADARGRDRRRAAPRPAAASSRADALAAIEARARVDVERIAEIEQTTDHDVIAFVSQVAETVGPEGRYLHLGLTSSDVVDTALALQLRAAGRAPARRRGRGSSPRSSPARGARPARVMMGRTHSVHAEPTTFGLKCAGWAFEVDRGPGPARRGRRRDRHRQDQRPGRDLQPPRPGRRGGGPRRARPARRPGEHPDRPARPARGVPRGHRRSSAARSSASRPRSATSSTPRSARSWSRSAGPEGQLAMPHKRNPILSERIAGLARLLRGYAQTGFENQPLWHERDISHSSAERVTLPDATILLDYMLVRTTGLVEGLVVRPERMRENIERGLGLHASSRVLLALVEQAGCRARTPMPSSSAPRCARPTSACRCATCSPRTRRSPASCRSRTSTPASTTTALLAHVPEVIARLDRLEAAHAAALRSAFVRSGKVRDLYRVGDDRLLLVASDRLSRVRRRPADARSPTRAGC